jgi:uncharacterized protein YecT (DUF1311 family)
VSLPPEVPQPANRPNTQPATATELQKVEREMTGFERATLRWARVAVLMSGLAALFVCLQWWEMHQGGIDTHDLAKATKAASVAASDQADAAQQFSDTAEDINSRMQDAVDQLEASANSAKASLKATQDAMRQDQRAWIAAGDYTYSIVESGPIESSAILSNVGKSPALDLRYRITGVTKHKSEVFDIAAVVYPPVLPILKMGALFPGQHVPIKAGGVPMDPVQQKPWFANVQSGEWIQYFFGDVRYQDTFGREHWTQFCTQFVPAKGSTPAGGTPCPIYNDTDDSKKKKAN